MKNLKNVFHVHLWLLAAVHKTSSDHMSAAVLWFFKAFSSLKRMGKTDEGAYLINVTHAFSKITCVCSPKTASSFQKTVQGCVQIYTVFTCVAQLCQPI